MPLVEICTPMFLSRSDMPLSPRAASSREIFFFQTLLNCDSRKLTAEKGKRSPSCADQSHDPYWDGILKPSAPTTRPVIASACPTG